MAETATMKATQLLLSLEKAGKDVHTFRWALTTGRLNLDLEWDIIQFLKAGKLSSVYDALRDGFSWFESFKTSSVQELEQKGWISKESRKLAERIGETKWFHQAQ